MENNKIAQGKSKELILFTYNILKDAKNSFNLWKASGFSKTYRLNNEQKNFSRVEDPQIAFFTPIKL